MAKDDEPEVDATGTGVRARPLHTRRILSAAALLDHWQGHRRLTRRVIEAFPEDELFRFSVGGMRPFGHLAGELIAMAAPMARGLVALDWKPFAEGEPATSRGELLRRWDESTRQIDEAWPRIPGSRRTESITSFGQYTGKGHWQILCVIDNEIHHRGQGYVYLRALEVEPPAFGSGSGRASDPDRVVEEQPHQERLIEQ